MDILIINGPNLNLLGLREPAIYGKASYSDLLGYLSGYSALSGDNLFFFQSNHEGSIIDFIQENYTKASGIVINPGAFAHYSYAIYDCLLSVPIPAVEVHISDIYSREPFRQNSVISPACIGTICGKGFSGYTEAIELLKKGSRTK
ncbi:MAG TPA: type II 3-dehydroquinate dehydratase [Bacillota bacterium]|nr:type II 3-dehydroquinate dehydratase [Bacillota bacterium]HPF42103.1 type II 3-dehydroquinate dehydratase [Bacillota bacterium]HPJ85825.1 type II 3-dehydroquinate dehydratase [Bacillota bacterium]HPQ61550.1 type II 3-dehydroquinate dehydratase [Bacillota bacterium]